VVALGAGAAGGELGAGVGAAAGVAAVRRAGLAGDPTERGCAAPAPVPGAGTGLPDASTYRGWCTSWTTTTVGGTGTVVTGGGSTGGAPAPVDGVVEDAFEEVDA
jgi:hypothetical protein